MQGQLLNATCWVTTLSLDVVEVGWGTLRKSNDLTERLKTLLDSHL